MGVTVTSGGAHVIQYVNRFVEQRSGLTLRDVVGRSVAEVTPGLIASGFVDRLDDVFRTGLPATVARDVVDMDIEGLPHTVTFDVLIHPLVSTNAVSGLLIISTFR